MGKWCGVALFAISLLIGYNLYDEFDPGVLNGRNVVITGGSAGIGKQMAIRYAQMGARLLITSRSEDKLKKVIERCKKEGRSDGVYLYHVADMADPKSAQSLIEVAEKQLGGIDYLVLNHITVVPMNPWKSTPENLTLLENVFNVNFMAYVRLASRAMPALQTSNGSIVVVSSVAGKIAQPLIAPYSASKFAVNGFFSAFRHELNLRNVDVSITICYIGLTDTTSAKEVIERSGILKLQDMYSSSADVAFAIIRGGTLRQRSIYYPYSYGRLAPIAYEFIPTVIEYLSTLVYNSQL